MAGSGSKVAIFAAIAANSIVTVAKFIGFVFTGSGSMLSESMHSLADVGNQTLLAVGLKMSQKPADESHPFGYEREAFVWALVSAVGIFFMGAGVSITHGVQALLSDHPHGAESGDWSWAIGILLFSFVIETISLLVALKGVYNDAQSHGKGLIEHFRTTDDPFGVAIIMEDGAAVFGVLIALGAVYLSAITHNPMWDAIGAILIGILLGLMAVFLIRKNRTMLLGKAIGQKDRAELDKIFEEDPAIEGVAMQAAVVRGTDSYRITAELDFDGEHIAELYLKERDLNELHSRLKTPEDLSAFLKEYGEAVSELIGDEVDRIEARIREKLPKAKYINIEPD